MGHKPLHELLNEDQEPFHLKNFLADRRSQLKTTTAAAGKTSLVVRKRKPIVESTSFCINHVCIFSSQHSPDFNKSPFLDFPTRELKSPCNNAAVFLNIPARTAAMLLDAATRVKKPETGSRQFKFGLLGSFLRRLKDRSARTKSREIEAVNVTPRRTRKKTVDGGGGDLSEKLSAVETSRSVCCEFEEIDHFCSNLSSPFHFSLERSPSPTRRKPDSLSPAPAASPSRHFQQEKEICEEVECPNEVKRQDDDEKEQCSPVSVLDPLFDDDEEDRDSGTVEEDDGYDIECCYANVQRAKHQLLQKLKRFELLAGLDPIDLENRMLEQCSDEDEDVLSSGEDVTSEECLREIVNHLGVGKIPWYMKKLVLDLIEEENKNEEHEMIVQRVCKQLHSWKVVELNTIDMMVETDFRTEGWKWCDNETIRNIGMDIEMVIFGFLMEELAQELVF
ncbi:hypothetical protein SSX86_012537 [Deinandra increscens subsp. villosa]|uniref:DUF4378 domain-containing protein n=1 Tax=Deinandra increscens subsp. villosa TaxID=3103831 RepID=A0AAP0DC31_9ASTR